MKKYSDLGFFAALLSALLATAFVYWPGLHGPFILDDINNLTPASIERLTVDDVAHAVFSNHSGTLGRPVSVLTFALNSYFSGLNEFTFKYTNLMVHLLNGLLLFWLGGRLLCQLAGQQASRGAWVIAGISAFIWLVHPLNVSTVLYVVQRMTQLSTLFTLAALLCYTIGRQRIVNNIAGGIRLAVVGLLLFAPLAALSKENGALIPLFVLLIEAVVFRFETPDRNSRKRLAALLFLVCILPLAAGFYYFVSHYESLLAGYDNRSFSLTERLLTQSQILFFYMRLILLPSLSAMGLFQDDFATVSQLDLITGLAIGGLMGLVVIAYLARRCAPVLTLGAGWFLIAHLLESTILPLELVFEHRNYTASYGLVLTGTYYLMHLTRNFSWAGTRYAISALIIALLSWMTAVQAFTWSDEELLLTITVEDHPTSARAHVAMANHYFRYLMLGDGRRHLETAARLTPHDAGPLIHMLYSHCNVETVPDELFESALDVLHNGIISAYVVQALSSLQDLKMGGRCNAMSAEKASRLTAAALQNPRRVYQTQLFYLHARLLSLTDDKLSAAPFYRAAFDHSPHGPMNVRIPALMDLAKILIDEGKYEDAHEVINTLSELDKSIKINYKNGILDLNIYLAQRLTEDGLLN